MRTTRILATVLLVALFGPLGSGPLGAPGLGAAPVGEDSDPRVLLVSFPRLTWDRLAAVDTPIIDEFLGQAAVASTSTRTVGARTSPGAAYLTIGAGNRTTATGADDGGAVLMPAESTDTGSAAEVFSRRSGVEASGRLLGLDFARIVRRNDSLLYGSHPGSLGEVLGGAGFGVAAVANADDRFGGTPARQAALSVLDDTGQAPLGEVGSTLLVSDPAAPGGVRFDPVVVLTAARRALDDGARMLVVEMSDLERAELARADSTVGVGDALYDVALESADELLGELLATVDSERDLVMLLAPTAPLDGEALTVFALRGPDTAAGWARSSTTRRDGYVALSDVAATAMTFLGVPLGEEMSETPITGSTSNESLDGRVDAMVQANDRAVFRDDAVGPLTVAFIVALVVMLMVVALMMALWPQRAARLRYFVLLVMSMPAATYLGGLLPYDPFEVATYGLALASIAAVIAAVCGWLGRGDPQGAPVAVAGVTMVVLVGDILTGGHLQLDTIFGYSPIVAGRFAGFGNQAFSLLGISTLVVACGGWQLLERSVATKKRPRLAGVLVMFTIVVVVVGAPTLGSDVGGVLASVPAFAVCALLLAGKRIRVRTAAVIAAATVAVLVVFAAVDLARAADSRTHLGRFAQQMIDGDGALILQRKLNANLSVLTSTVWTWVIPAALAFFVYLTWRPNNVLRQINGAQPTFRAFGVSAITLGVVAWALNDSGVSMPALMLTLALPYTALLAIGMDQPELEHPT